MISSKMMMYKDVSQKIKEVLCEQEHEIIRILTRIETYQMAKDELSRSRNLWDNIEQQSTFLDTHLDEQMSVYLPLNQPLYSFMLNVVIPSLILKTIYYRPSKAQSELHGDLFIIFRTILENIVLCVVSRKEFFKQCVSRSKYVNFTGKYENALELQMQLSKSTVMIYNGSGINPIVIGGDANIDKAVKDVIEARIYNSGQDCMAPTCIFLEKSISETFMKLLVEKVACLKIGINEEERTEIGPLLEKDSLTEFVEIRNKYQNNVFLDGCIHWENRIMTPAIFYFNEIIEEPKKIYYAPYFFVMTFSSLEEIQAYLDKSYCERYAGYISLYGKSAQSRKWISGGTPLISLNDTTLFYEENGNMPFGGYGLGCSFVSHNGIVSAHPILILRDIIKYSGE